MSEQIYRVLMTDFTKANRRRREVILKRYGFTDPEKYVQFLNNYSENTEVAFYTTERIVSLTKVVEIMLSHPHKLMQVSYSKQGGEERLLQGYHIGKCDHFGRTEFVEQTTEGSQVRVADNRTINFIVLNHIKYRVR